MYIIAGPPGSGKSTVFPLSGFGVDFFNADDRAAQLNQGSYGAFRKASAIRSTANSRHL
jgi:predicted ABC-type ATPase